MLSTFAQRAFKLHDILGGNLRRLWQGLKDSLPIPEVEPDGERNNEADCQKSDNQNRRYVSC